MRSSGKIKVHSENMMPIIKKWLYSDRDIFIRELISNACDAIAKINKLISYGEANITVTNPKVEMIVDKTNGTITISDNGLGMTEEEVKKYINQIAFSGAEDFAKKYSEQSDAANGIIGHFGLGFYSAFMVSNKVEIDTLSYQENAYPVCWSCDGGSEYKIKDGTRTNVGTSIILHISEDSIEFLEITKVRELVQKYCAFMQFPIFIHSDKEKSDKAANDSNPLWNKEPKDCTDEEYKEFYKEVFHDYTDPLFWIHLNVSHPFTLKGILYFPKHKNTYEPIQGKVSLYNNQVFVADNIKEVIPEFMLLLKGIIDCPEMPLNVSRSFLQNDGTIKKISAHITKKVADKLIDLFHCDLARYNKCWDDIAPFLKYGCMSDEKFYEKVKDILTVKTINDEYITLNEYKKSNKTIYYITDEKVQASYVSLFNKNNKDAVYLNHEIDKHYIGFLEYKQKEYKFMRIDAEIPEEIQDTDKKDYTTLIDKFKKAIDIQNYDVKTLRLKDANIPAMITLSEEARRMKDMQEMYKDISSMVGALDHESIILNTSNNIIKSIPYLKKSDCKLICNIIYDLAKINHRQLQPIEMELYTNRASELLDKYTISIKSDVEIADVEIIL